MSTAPFHLTGNHAPVDAERTAHNLPVTGAVPPELTGWYIRNGPNPRTPSGHWFTGEGMLHAVRLQGGRATCYRNRWVRTASLQDPTRRPYRPDGTQDLAAGPANTHLIRHAGRTFALVESALPYEISCNHQDLTTIGPHDFAGRLTTSMTAHPKTCPDSGELHFFGYGALTPPHVTYHRADATGNLIISRPLDAADIPTHTMMHDMALTTHYVVFLHLPVVFDKTKAAAGGMPYHFAPDHPARIGLLRRADPYGPVHWFEVEACYVFHVVNAYEDARGRVRLHVVRYPHLWWEGHGKADASLWCWTLDPEGYGGGGSGTSVREEQLDDRPCEFPRIDDRLTGHAARFGYVTDVGEAADGGGRGTDARRAGAILRYDLTTGSATAHEFAAGRTPGEACFVPRAPGLTSDDGWLLSYVYDATTDRSDLVILDTADLTGAPAAVVHLPWRVPFGFHGNWLPDGVAGEW
ncbi:MAG TPA: carotenoid oxygenase family protein [Nitrolancea sp.]|nr:carotenoid oxygenase family protein [Nitrolancea sp.]